MVKTASPITEGVKYFANLSIKRSVGAFFSSAFSTSSTILARVVSFDSFVTSISRYPFWLIVPA